MDALLRAELEEDRIRLLDAYLESEDPQDRQLIELIELLLEVPEAK